MQPTTRRAAEVATVLARHGLGTIVDFLDLRSLAARHAPKASPGGVTPVRIRRALEELGPTFVKLGQVLSTRPDLVPPAYEAELSRLQDGATPVPAHEIDRAVEASLGRSVGDLFSRFDSVPLAAASIGQVHAAALPDGTEVVVKVRRPRVVEQIDVDLALMDRVAARLARHRLFARYDPRGLAGEFATTLRGELDYLREGRNAETVAACFEENDAVHVPSIVWSHTCTSVITEERIRGAKIDDLVAIDAAGYDRRKIARTFADAYLSMVFEHRFFHADPHPGNVFVDSADRIVFVDFGMVGEVKPDAIGGLAIVLRALAAVDAETMADGLLRLGIACDYVARAELVSDLARFLDRYARVPVGQLRLGPLLTDLMSVVRAHQLHLPSDLALLLKTVMMCEGVAVTLDPDFLLVPVLMPYAARLATD